MKKLIVAEVFYSLQCEGREIGVPAVFLRLGGCNLLCSAAWVCDTIEVWKKGQAKLFSEILPEECWLRLRQGAHLVITGGEPLMQQSAIVDFLEWLNMPNLVVEVETNGTIMPNGYLMNKVSRWNVSPKLQNSGEPITKRIKDEVIATFNSLPETIFKFVITSKEDLEEISQDFDIDKSKLVLMPGGSTREELDATRMIAVNAALVLCCRYSERLHIVIWNQKTGV